MGKQLKVRVSFTDDEGNAEARTSATYPSGTATVDGGAGGARQGGGRVWETTEAGGTDTFEVALLTSAPTHDVTVTPSSSDAGEGTVSGALRFSTTDWGDAQTVTVTGVDDAEVDGDQGYEVRFVVASTDTGYDAIAVEAVAG